METFDMDFFHRNISRFLVLGELFSFQTYKKSQLMQTFQLAHKTVSIPRSTKNAPAAFASERISG